MSKKDFILSKKGKMRVKDIADTLGCSPAYVCKILKPKAKVIVMNGYFDIDKEYKQTYYGG